FDYDCFGQLAGISTQDETHEIELAGMSLARFDDSLFLTEVDAPLVRMNEDGEIEDIYIFDPSGSPLATIGDETIFHLDDGIGNIVATATHSGLENTFNFNPFGEHSKDADWSSPFRWKGYLYLPDVELYHLGARQFDPEIMSFTSFDPAYPALTTDDPFAFAGWDPVNGYEILGLVNCDCNRAHFNPNPYQTFVQASYLLTSKHDDCFDVCGEKIKGRCVNDLRLAHNTFAGEIIAEIRKLRSQYAEWTSMYNSLVAAIMPLYDQYNKLNDSLEEMIEQRDKQAFFTALSVFGAVLLFIPGANFVGLALMGMTIALKATWDVPVSGGSVSDADISGAIGDASSAVADEAVNSMISEMDEVVGDIAGKAAGVGGALIDIISLFNNQAGVENIQNALNELKNKLDQMNRTLAQSGAIGSGIQLGFMEREGNFDFDCCKYLEQLLSRAINDPACDCDETPAITAPPPSNNPLNRPPQHTPGYLGPTSSDDAIPRPAGEQEPDPTHCISGVILEKIQAGEFTYIKIKTPGGKIVVLKIKSDTEVLDERGVRVLICNFKVGDRIRACGSRPPDTIPCADTMEPDTVIRIGNPYAEPDPGDPNPPDEPGDPIPPDDPDPPPLIP
ncbi:MAG: hypothetical protein KAH30_04750, partial [Caldisericia bacterium]|nr:hypothetical protein [Caldisericia bacterium]